MQNASICLVTVTVESDFLFIVLGCKYQSLRLTSQGIGTKKYGIHQE